MRGSLLVSLGRGCGTGCAHALVAALTSLYPKFLDPFCCTGFGTGHLNTVTPALVMETSETRVRGRTFSLTFLANYM